MNLQELFSSLQTLQRGFGDVKAAGLDSRNLFAAKHMNNLAGNEQLLSLLNGVQLLAGNQFNFKIYRYQD